MWARTVALELPDSTVRAVEYATFWTMQVIFVLLGGLWIVLIFIGICGAVYGHFIVRSLKGSSCARAKAAVRTSRLSLGISASAMIGQQMHRIPKQECYIK